jgi:hypothetical protein
VLLVAVAINAWAVKEWTEFLTEHDVGLLDSRQRVKLALSRYAEYRATGPLPRRLAASTWVWVSRRWRPQERGIGRHRCTAAQLRHQAGDVGGRCL